jgi:hypothetical protein
MAKEHRPESSEEDPELQDENDPEYKEEQCETFKYRGVKPEQITTDPEFREYYREWLKKHANE